MSNQTTRRGAIGAMVSVSATAFIPAIAASAMPIRPSPFRLAEAHYKAVRQRFNNIAGDLELNDPIAFYREQEAYNAALHAVDSAPCQSWDEFADAFRLAVDDGDSLPNEDLVMKLLADIRRLSGRA